MGEKVTGFKDVIWRGNLANCFEKFDNLSPIPDHSTGPSGKSTTSTRLTTPASVPRITF